MIILATFFELLLYIGICFADHRFAKLNNQKIKQLWLNKQKDAFWQCDSKENIVLLSQLALAILSIIMALRGNYSRGIGMMLIALLGDVLLWHYIWKISRQRQGRF